MFDISASGAQIQIKFRGKNTLTISHFSDEGTPFEAPDIDTSDNRTNLNGDMISSRLTAVKPVSVTVIPGSFEDIVLQARLQESNLMPGNATPISDLVVESLTIIVPSIDASGAAGSAAGNTYIYTNGRMKGGPTGPSTSAEGRIAARTYRFEFEKFETVHGMGTGIR